MGWIADNWPWLAAGFYAAEKYVAASKSKRHDILVSTVKRVSKWAYRTWRNW